MRYRSLLILTISAGVSAFAACGGPAGPNTNAVNAPATNAANIGGGVTHQPDSPVATNRRVEAAKTNDAPTVAAIMTAYYDALKKKDDAALQKVLTADYIKRVQAEAKAEKKPSMTAYLAEYDIVTDKPVEVRNEKIEGDKARAEIRGGAYINWTPFFFLRENGVWKFTGSSPDVQGSKPSAPKK